jgi:integrase
VIRIRQNGTYTDTSFATASDERWLPANGTTILHYFQARSRAHELYVDHRSNRSKDGQILTVTDAVDDYIADRERRGRDISGVTYRAQAHIIPALGTVLLSELTAPALERFLHDTANRPPLRRSAMYSKKVRFAEDVDMDDPEIRRRRQASANRIWSDLRAAVNRSYRGGWIDRRPWTRVQIFRSTDSARKQILTLEESRKLLAACNADFRNMVHAALVTGCRYGELCALRAANYDRALGLLHISKSKNGRTRDVTLSDEGQALFGQLSRMKLPEAMLLTKADGTSWGKSEQSRRMKAACIKAGLDPMDIHRLRHTYASLLIMNGVRTILVAQNLGHRDTRMVERHYGHLTDSYKAEMIRSLSPTFQI